MKSKRGPRWKNNPTQITLSLPTDVIIDFRKIVYLSPESISDISLKMFTEFIEQHQDLVEQYNKFMVKF